jgi:hypothetical protein
MRCCLPPDRVYGGVRGDGIRIVVPTPEDAAGAVQLLLDRGVDIDSF